MIDKDCPKAITKPDVYECKLSDELYKLAEDELRETKATREHSLKAMRDWIVSNPRIATCRMDSTFLLRFLRCKKFSIPMTQESLERYLLLRRSYDGAFQNFDMTLEPMNALLRAGYIFALPQRDKLGRRIVFYRPSVFDPHKYINVDLLKLHGIAYETLMENEENQIRGFVHIADGSGVSMPYLTLFTPKEAVRIAKNGEKILPMRHKEINGFNVHPSLKFAVDFGFSLISEKMKSRIKLHTTLDSATHIDRSLLPKEYGGTIPMADMIDAWLKELAAHQEILLLHDKMAVKVEMYSAKAREGAVTALKQSLNNCSCEDDSNLSGLQGSFRKLEVD